MLHFSLAELLDMEFEELVRTWFPLGLAPEGFGAGLALVTGPLGLAAAGDRRSLMSKPDMDICSALVAQGRAIWANESGSVTGSKRRSDSGCAAVALGLSLLN